MENTIDWEHIRVAFAEAFNPADVDFRVQGKASESTGKAQVVCFVDARTVQDRLDAVVGPGAWAFDYTPLAVDAKGVVLSAKGVLTIHGVSKSDIGDASNFEASKGTVSDALKRAAVQWGIGRYLYAVPSAWVAADKSGKIAPDVLRDLRAKLPRPASATPTTQHATPEARPAPVTQATPPAPAAQQAKPAKPAPATIADPRNDDAPTPQQLVSIHKLCEAVGKPDPEPESIRTYGDARRLILDLTERYKAYRGTHSKSESSAKPTTKAAPASDRKAPPAQGSVRLSGRQCGYETQADYDAMVVRVTHKSGKWTAADQWLVYDFLTEKQAIDAQRVMDAATQGEPELVCVEATA